MAWVVMLTSPAGDSFYGEAIDRDGCRYRCKNSDQAELFEMKSAEASFYDFQLMKALVGGINLKR